MTQKSQTRPYGYGTKEVVPRGHRFSVGRMRRGAADSIPIDYIPFKRRSRSSMEAIVLNGKRQDLK